MKELLVNVVELSHEVAPGLCCVAAATVGRHIMVNPF